MKTARRLSWIPLAFAAGGLLAQLDGALFLTAITICWTAGLIVADRNGRTGKPGRDPISHVRTIPTPSELDDALLMSIWDRERDLIADGIPAKVGVDKHSGLCHDICRCGRGASA